MATSSKIQWTDATWTPIRARIKQDAHQIALAKGYTSLLPIVQGRSGKVGPHCEHVSPGCDNCYSETNNGRCLPTNGTGLPFDRRSRDLVDIFLDENILFQPLHWKKPRKVFVCSQTDLFAEFVPDEFIVKMFTVMESCYWHTFQVLTKRAQRMQELLSHPHFPSYVRKFGYDWLGPKRYNERGPHWHNNQWLGVSVEDQQRADERIPHLLATPAAIRWVSYEPALGRVDFTQITERLAGESWQQFSALEEKDSLNKGTPRQPLDWIVAGGESGHGARPMDLAWLRSVRDQSKAAGVPLFVKQLGAAPHSIADRISHRNDPLTLEPGFYRYLNDRKGADPSEWPADLRIREMPGARA